MKIQSLAVIFIIIILPISMVLSSYLDSGIQTISLQTSYDSKLQNATYDAIKAFQLNSSNSDTSDLTNSKLRDINASANTFFNSLASNFNMSGYGKETLQSYVPALVYTMYDGYYIYAPFSNTLNGTTVSSDSKYQNGENIYGLKPYVYYSCQYKTSGVDIVITYSLDNYINITGTINGNPENISGYLLSNLTVNGNSITYKGNTIDTETGLKQNVMVDGNKILCSWRKINGVKYYVQDGSNEVFTVINGKKYIQTGVDANKIRNNDNAKQYFLQAAKLKTFIDQKLSGLKTSNAVDSTVNNQEFKDEMGDYKIFDFDNNKGIESVDSKFNQHRLAVIRHCIEKNLSVAISSYNSYSGVTASFEMPKLKESDWDKLLNNISMITFMQGLSIGGKIYNGYAIVPNTENEEVVTENSIYMKPNNNSMNETYYKIIDKTLTKNTNYTGYYNSDFEIKSVNIDNQNNYYIPILGTASYSSIVTSSNLVPIGLDVEGNNTNESYLDIYDYLNGSSTLAKNYYTALARERYGMYRVGETSSELMSNILK